MMKMGKKMRQIPTSRNLAPYIVIVADPTRALVV